MDNVICFHHFYSVDWASLAKQWIQLKETQPETPVTSVGLSNATLAVPPPPPPPPPPHMASLHVPPPPTTTSTHMQSLPPPPGVSVKDSAHETDQHGEMDMEIEDDAQPQTSVQNGYNAGERTSYLILNDIAN